MKKNLIYIAIFCAISSVSFFACNKKSNSTSTAATSGQFYVISNSALANAADTIQAVSLDSKNNVSCFFYGSYDAGGNPAQLRHAAVRHGDTVLNFLFDSAFHVQEMYCTVAGVPDTTVFSFVYYTDSVALVTYHTNWQPNDMVLRSITKVNTANGNYSFIGNKTFRTTGLANYIVDAGYGTQAIKVCDFLINAGKAGILTLSLGAGGYVLAENPWIADAIGTAIDNRGAIGLAIGAYLAPASSNTTQVQSLNNVDDPVTNQPVIPAPDPVDVPTYTSSLVPDWTFTYYSNSVYNSLLDIFNLGSFCQFEIPGSSTYSGSATTQLHFKILAKDGSYNGIEVIIANFTGEGVYNITQPIATNSAYVNELLYDATYTCGAEITDPMWGVVNISLCIPGYSLNGTFTLGTAQPSITYCGNETSVDTFTNGIFCIPFRHQ